MMVSQKEIEVRYAETDQMGVVYHANYVIWLEIGRAHFVQQLGFQYADMERRGIVSPVIDLQISYKKPLRYGETATIKTWVESYDGIRVVYGYEVLTSTNEIAATATSKHVCVTKETFQPVLIRKYFPDWHEAYERAKKR